MSPDRRAVGAPDVPHPAPAGPGLLSGRGSNLPLGAFDVLLLASTTALGAVAYAVPGGSGALAMILVFAVPFACALLPGCRALLQVAYAVLVSGCVLGLAVRAGDLTAAMAGVQWLLVAAVVATIGLVVRRLTEHLRRRTRIAEAVAKLGQRALSVTEPDELLSQALSLAVDVIGSEYGTALRQLPDGRLRVAGELGPDPLTPGTIVLPASEGSYAQRIMQSGQAFESADLARDPRVTPPESLLRRGVVSGLAVPVLGSGGPLGVLAVHFRRRRRFTRDEVAAVTTLAGVVATAWEHAAQRQLIGHQAMHDSLTDLPNRALFLDRLEHALSRRTTSEGAGSGVVTLMLIDLDNFKSVNDSLGHRAGDELLVGLAERLLSALRPEDTVARLGGDEFAVLCERAPDEHAVAHLVDRVQSAAAETLRIGGATLTVTASVGVTIADQSPDPNRTPRAMLREADSALQAAKRESRGASRLFDERMQLQTRNRLQLESELRRAIDRDEFVLYYQPIRSATDRHVLGVEALVRWEHPKRGLVAPGEFIPVAEQTGLIVPLGRWVLDTALAQVARWQHEQRGSGREAIWVAVNVSPRQLDDPDLSLQVSSAVQATGLAEGTLWLELTETALLDDSAAGLRAVTALCDAGAQLALDDFGTGYSSLTHLTRYPIGALKVDGSFVAGLGRDARDSAVVAAVIALGSELGMRVIAEGVESPEQLSALEGTGCYGVQGFLLDYPSATPALGPSLRVSAH